MLRVTSRYARLIHKTALWKFQKFFSDNSNKLSLISLQNSNSNNLITENNKESIVSPPEIIKKFADSLNEKNTINENVLFKFMEYLEGIRINEKLYSEKMFEFEKKIYLIFLNSNNPILESLSYFHKISAMTFDENSDQISLFFYLFGKGVNSLNISESNLRNIYEISEFRSLIKQSKEFLKKGCQFKNVDKFTEGLFLCKYKDPELQELILDFVY